MSKYPVHTDDGKPDQKLCAECKHWKISHSAFSGCVAGYTDNDGNWHDCPCIEYEPQP